MSARKTTRKQCEAAMLEARRRFGHRANVTGFDVGYRWNGDKRSDELCARIHVRAKIPVAELESTEVFPKEINGVPLDVIQGPYRVNRTTIPTEHRIRSPYLMGGLSCGRVNDGTGTIGAVVIDEQTGRPALLSNWHVLAGPSAQVGDPVLQPGQIDNGVPLRDQVASLSRWMLETGGDAAIAVMDGRRPWLPLQFGSFAVTGKARDSKLGEILVKSGRTTGQTRARVDGEGFYRLFYEVRPGVEEMREIRGFKLVPIETGNADDIELSAGGDSGSIWQSETSGDAVGLHFAGEGNPDPAAEHSIACNLTTVLDRLNVRLATFEDAFSAADADDVHAMADRMHRGTGRRTPELSVPDWPPYPWPWPGTGGPWPGPWPWPWPWAGGAGGIGAGSPEHARRHRSPLPYSRGAVDPLRYRPRDTGAAFERLRRRPERSLDAFDDIWPRLQIAMRRFRDFDGATVQDKLETFIPQGVAAAVMARIINESGAFADLGLPTVNERDFDTAHYFSDICAAILDLLNE